jgi:hypothetical protein
MWYEFSLLRVGRVMTIPTIDIHWQEYIPARPPEAGEYLVVAIHKATGKRDTFFASYEKDKYDWETGMGENYIVTHYVKIELP